MGSWGSSLRSRSRCPRALSHSIRTGPVCNTRAAYDAHGAVPAANERTGLERVKAAADGPLGTPRLSDLGNKPDVRTLAVAFVYGRTSIETYRAKAADAMERDRH